MVLALVDMSLALPVASSLVVVALGLGLLSLVLYRRDNAPRETIRRGHRPLDTIREDLEVR